MKLNQSIMDGIIKKNNEMVDYINSLSINYKRKLEDQKLYYENKLKEGLFNISLKKILDQKIESLISKNSEL